MKAVPQPTACNVVSQITRIMSLLAHTSIFWLIRYPTLCQGSKSNCYEWDKYTIAKEPESTNYRGRMALCLAIECEENIEFSVLAVSIVKPGSRVVNTDAS
jgi:hypothetical protein